MSLHIASVPTNVQVGDLYHHFSNFGPCVIQTQDGNAIIKFRDALCAVRLANLDPLDPPQIKGYPINYRLMDDDLTLGDLALRTKEIFPRASMDILENVIIKHLPFLLCNGTTANDETIRSQAESIATLYRRIYAAVQRLKLSDNIERALKFEIKFYELPDVLRIIDECPDWWTLSRSIFSGALFPFLKPTRDAVVHSKHSLEHIKDFYRDYAKTKNLSPRKLELMNNASYYSVMRCLFDQGKGEVSYSIDDLKEATDNIERPELKPVSDTEKALTKFLFMHMKNAPQKLFEKLERTLRHRIQYDILARIIDPEYDMFRVKGAHEATKIKDIFQKLKPLLIDELPDDPEFFPSAPNAPPTAVKPCNIIVPAMNSPPVLVSPPAVVKSEPPPVMAPPPSTPLNIRPSGLYQQGPVGPVSGNSTQGGGGVVAPSSIIQTLMDGSETYTPTQKGPPKGKGKGETKGKGPHKGKDYEWGHKGKGGHKGDGKDGKDYEKGWHLSHASDSPAYEQDYSNKNDWKHNNNNNKYHDNEWNEVKSESGSQHGDNNNNWHTNNNNNNNNNWQESGREHEKPSEKGGKKGKGKGKGKGKYNDWKGDGAGKGSKKDWKGEHGKGGYVKGKNNITNYAATEDWNNVKKEWDNDDNFSNNNHKQQQPKSPPHGVPPPLGGPSVTNTNPVMNVLHPMRPPPLPSSGPSPDVLHSKANPGPPPPGAANSTFSSQPDPSSSTTHNPKTAFPKTASTFHAASTRASPPPPPPPPAAVMPPLHPMPGKPGFPHDISQKNHHSYNTNSPSRAGPYNNTSGKGGGMTSGAGNAQGKEGKNIVVGDKNIFVPTRKGKDGLYSNLRLILTDTGKGGKGGSTNTGSGKTGGAPGESSSTTQQGAKPASSLVPAKSHAFGAGTGLTERKRQPASSTEEGAKLPRIDEHQNSNGGNAASGSGSSITKEELDCMVNALPEEKRADARKMLMKLHNVA